MSEYVNVAVAVVSAVGAVYLGLRQARQGDRANLTGRLAAVEQRVDEADDTIQMLRRREVWHEQKENILVGVLYRHGIEVPEMPEPPDSWTA